MKQTNSLATSQANQAVFTAVPIEPVRLALRRAGLRQRQVLAYVHPGVVERIAGTLKVDSQEAQLVFLETKRFLWLCNISGEVLVPSATIDEGWHAFVLHTRDYAAFCEQYLDAFVHHQPHSKASRQANADDGAAYRRTLDLARVTFGEQLSEHWAGQADSTDCSGSTNCQAPYR